MIFLKNYLKIITLLLTITVCTFIFYGINNCIFGDKEQIINYINKFGLLAPIFFIILQIIQVVIPIIPGGVSTLAGVIAFGSIRGFIYNYIGIIIGSIIAFFLAKKYGFKIINFLFKEEKVNKYLNNKRFNTLFILSIFLPCLPDDLMCFIAGISKMSFKTFLLIILLCKPLSIFLYSFGFNLL